ncbi:hypothetical protein T4A_1328 [Trichinella pseudospiralis]|uniref:Uncharacterized protein n=1 Tax=Trichinella pseudospiralis TaxID=6337 RepID=A0A0V1F0U7_TRIPS|nr:hypothetical protein T4A_1328 [Trichinella pseudospiralis]
MRNMIDEYPPVDMALGPYEGKFRKCIKDSWLVPYNEREHGLPKNTPDVSNPAKQEKGQVVRQFQGFGFLGFPGYGFLGAERPHYTADADMCNEELREWRRQGVNVALIDLNKAYCRFALTKLCDPNRRWSSKTTYINSILVNKSVVSVDRVKRHLAHYGLIRKTHERAADGARFFGLKVWGRGARKADVERKRQRRSIGNQRLNRGRQELANEKDLSDDRLCNSALIGEDGLPEKARMRTKAIGVQIRAGCRPTEVRMQQGGRTDPRAAAVTQATRSWASACMRSDCRSRRGKNNRRRSIRHGLPGNKANIARQTDLTLSKHQMRERWKQGNLEVAEETSTSTRASIRHPRVPLTNIWKDQGGHWPKVVEQKRHR